MDKAHYEEMRANLNGILRAGILENKKVYLFGHCNATETLVDLLLDKGIPVSAILDNNEKKLGKSYRGIVIKMPQEILMEKQASVVCIAARAYASMAYQLKQLDYKGEIYRLVEYDSFAEYSLSENTRKKKQERLERGLVLQRKLTEKFPDYMKVFCPFQALGDVCFAMSYLPCFMSAREMKRCVIGVIGRACAQIVRLFWDYPVETFSQKEMDEIIQASLYAEDKNFFIAHQDRPYVIDLHKALSIKCIPLEQIYCCGVFGLPRETRPYYPTHWKTYSGLDRVQKGKAVILSPYAKSVPALPDSVWEQIVGEYTERRFQCFTNVVGDEKPLTGTFPISPAIAEMQSLVEYAGTFIGIRSGLCDILRYSECYKVALYPDYYYCDTQWKAIDMYALEGWENLVVKDGFIWKKR